MKKGKLLLISGPSGVGKKTLISEILQDKELNIVISVSLTTRKIRPEERHGIDYFFVSHEEFEEKIRNGKMLEYARFFNNFYGTSKEGVEEKLNKGFNVLLEIETEGFHQIKKKYPDLLSIFILPTSIKELEKRLRSRGTEKDEDISMRMKKAQKEISESHLFTYQVVNDNLERATKELKNILKHEL